jgi:hypothetical protein
MNETTGTDADKPTRADIGRVYLHGTTVRVMLVNDRQVSQTPDDFEVIVKCVDPSDDGSYPVLPVDCRNLIATDEWVHPTEAPNRNVVLILSACQAALVHAMVRESGWGYTEAGMPEVAAELLALAGEIRKCRDASGTAEVVPLRYNSLFDAQFAGVSDRKMITGEGPE